MVCFQQFCDYAIFAIGYVCNISVIQPDTCHSVQCYCERIMKMSPVAEPVWVPSVQDCLLFVKN